MHFKEFVIVVWGSSLIGTAGYLLFAQRVSAFGASVFMIASALFLVIVLNVDAVSSIAGSYKDVAQFRVEVQRIANDLYAKVDYVRSLGEEVARSAAHTVATSNRYVDEDDHQRQMLNERERIRAMMEALGSEESKIAQVLDQINKTVASDLKERVVSSAGKVKYSDPKAHEELIDEFRDKMRDYDDRTSRDSLIAFLKERKRSGPIRLNSSLRFLSGLSAHSHAASLPVGSITA